MADDKLEVRDLREADEGPYLTKSNAELDLEARLGEDAQKVGPVTVNPNPVGSVDEESGGTYVGTDPVYQNASTDANRPYDADEGVEKDVLDSLKEDYDTDGVEGKVVDDYGFGGKAEVAGSQVGGRTYRTLLPGQEGYDRDKAEEQSGPPLRVYDDESSDDKGDDEVVEAENTGTNLGSTVEAPVAPDAPESAAEGGGNKPTKAAKVKAGESGS